MFRGDTKANFVDRREFTGPVLKQIDAAYDYALSKINMGMEIRGIYRHDVYEIPPAAIRELIVNAVVHRQYINPHAASIQVALYDRHLDIVSPGGLPHGMTIAMMEEGHSRARNKALALACRYMRIIEEWGSGIPRIQRMLAEAGLKPLEIIDNGINLQFRIWRPGQIGQKSALSAGDAKSGRSAGSTGEKAIREKTREKQVAVNVTREKIVHLLQENPNATQNDIATSTGLSVKGVEWNLRALKASGVIRRVGPDKGGHWEVVGC